MSYKNVQFHLGHLSLQNLMQKNDLNKLWKRELSFWTEHQQWESQC